MRIGYEITSESCYSGKICHEAKEWWEDNKFIEEGIANPNFYPKYLVI